MIQANYESKMEEIQKVISSSSKIALTPFEKVTVIKI